MLVACLLVAFVCFDFLQCFCLGFGLWLAFPGLYAYHLFIHLGLLLSFVLMFVFTVCLFALLGFCCLFFRFDACLLLLLVVIC